MLTEGIPYKSILKFALPLMLANILQQLYTTVDTIVVGNFISQNALAGVGACMYIAGLYISIAIALALGVGVLVSQSYGACDERKMKRAASTGTMLMLLLGVCVSVFSYFTSEPILKHFVSVPEEVLHLSVMYAKTYSLGLIFQFGYNCFAAILRAVGNSRSSLYFLIITTVVNVVLDLLFVIVFKLGVVGVAVATCISQLVAMVISYVYMVRNYPIFRPQFEFELPVVKDIFKTGVPLTIQALIVNCGFMIMQKIANSFGVGMTASYAVSCRLELYMIVPIVSMLHAVSTFAGQNLGANKLYRLGEGVRQTILMNLCIALLVGSFCFVAAPWLISLFALKGEAYRYALSHVRVASVDLLFYAMYTPVSGLCIGLGKSFVLSVISLVELSGRIIFALLLAGVIGAGCVWWSEALAWLFVVILVFIYYNKVLRKEIENKLGEG